MQTNYLILVLLVGVFSGITAKASAQYTSTQEERIQWVKVTHKMESAPLDDSVSKEGEAAFKRLSEVHHVHVLLCPALLSEFNGMKYAYAHTITRQYMLASGVFQFGIGWVLETFGGPQANLATFLSGIGEYKVRENALNVPHYRMWESGYFVQDDIRLSQRLTVNAGLRYDIFTPFTEIQNRISNFNPSRDELVIASSSERTAGIVTHYHNVAPRVGFAQSFA